MLLKLKADNFSTVCEATVYKMSEPRRLTTLWVPGLLQGSLCLLDNAIGALKFDKTVSMKILRSTFHLYGLPQVWAVLFYQLFRLPLGSCVRYAAAALSANNVSLSIGSCQAFSSGSNLCSLFERKGVLCSLS
jgi:hypothetical protein